MEDAHAAVLDLQPEGLSDQEAASADKRIGFFGVYDGHGGDKVAIYAGEQLHKIIAKQEAFKSLDLERALKDGFLATDRAILNGMAPVRSRHWNPLSHSLGTDPKYEEEVSGCTSSVALVTRDKIYVVCGSCKPTRGTELTF